MKKIFSIILLSFLFAHVSAQEVFLLGKNLMADSLKRNCAIISSEYFFASNCITNELGTEYFRNGFITKEMKDNVSKNLEDGNRFGAEWNSQFVYMHRYENLFGGKTIFYVGASNSYHIDSRFGNDVFEIYFRGNKKYADKTADLSNFQFNSLNYQQINLGLIRNYKSGEGMLTLGFGIGISKGQSLLSIRTANASVYTQPQGEYLDVMLNLLMYKSDSAKNDIAAFNGIGISTDWFASYTNEIGNALNFSVQNAGSIFWNSKTTVLNTDSTFRFEGIDVEELFSFGDSINASGSLDSIYVHPFLTNKKQETVSTPLPVTVQGDYSFILNDSKWSFDAGVVMKLHSNFRIQQFVNCVYAFNKNNILNVRVAYGGYSKIGIGLGYTHATSHGWAFRASTDYLNSVIIYNKGTAQSAFVSLEKSF